MSGLRTVRPNIEAMTPEQFQAFLDKPRTCHGPCKRTLTVQHFSITSERGRKVVRTICKDCMSSYYKSITELRRENRRAEKKSRLAEMRVGYMAWKEKRTCQGDAK